MSIGERDLIEVAHPVPQDSAAKRYELNRRVNLVRVENILCMIFNPHQDVLLSCY